MKIIPVIDLLNGQVVHAKHGERQHYQAIQSQLTHSNKPLDIVAALLDIYPFNTLYIADLNRIQQLPNDDSHIVVAEKLKKRYPNLTLWVDAGFKNTNDLKTWLTIGIQPIIGTENFTQYPSYEALTTDLNKSFSLSLDFMPTGYKGPAAILNESDKWPQDIIVMSLANVGANQGPDFKKLQLIQHKNQRVNIYAAGGIRNLNDLILLKQQHIHGVLIASALHQKQISQDDLLQLQTIKA